MKNLIVLFQVVFLSNLINAQWVQTNSFNGKEINVLATKENYIFAGTEGSGVYRSTNDGSDWTQINIGLSSSVITSFAISEDNIFVGTYDRGVFLSTNNGSSWKAVNNGLTSSHAPDFARIFSFAVNGNNIFVGTLYGVYLSTDNGSNWNSVNNGLGENTEFLHAFPLTITGNNIFVGTYPGGVFLSTDNGLNWTAVNNGINKDTNGRYDVRLLTVIGSQLVAGVNGSGDSFVIKSSIDNGSNWSSINNGLDYHRKSSIAFSGNNMFVSSAYDPNVYLSINNGTDWFLINDGLPEEININALITSGSYILAGTDDLGIWRRPLSEIVTDIKVEQNNLPINYSLMQNYPNPFNPFTKINYSIPKSSFVKIKVYSMLGEEVVTLVSEEKSVGNYEIVFDGNTLSSGVYLYRMESESFVNTKKFILLK